MTRRFWNRKDRKTGRDEYSGDQGSKQQNPHSKDAKQPCHAADFAAAITSCAGKFAELAADTIRVIAGGLLVGDPHFLDHARIFCELIARQDPQFLR
jgi:hypothetical protein